MREIIKEYGFYTTLALLVVAIGAASVYYTDSRQNAKNAAYYKEWCEYYKGESERLYVYIEENMPEAVVAAYPKQRAGMAAPTRRPIPLK